MAAPTLVSYNEVVNGWVDNTNSDTTPRSTASISWLAGDIIVAVGGCQDGSSTLNLPTATGLTFASVFGAQIGTSSSNCGANIWTASPSGSGSSAVAGGTTGGSFIHWGLSVWVWRGSTGLGNHASNVSAETLSLVRSGTNSVVCGCLCDWNATATTGYAFTPTVGNDRVHGQETTDYSVYVADWGDQGSAGTTSYGITGITGGPFTNVMIEVLGGSSGTDATVTLGPSRSDLLIHP